MLWRRWGRAGATPSRLSLCLACPSLGDGRRVRAPPRPASGARRSRGRPPSLCVIRSRRGNLASRDALANQSTASRAENRKRRRTEAARNDKAASVRAVAAPQRGGVMAYQMKIAWWNTDAVRRGVYSMFPGGRYVGACMDATDRPTDRPGEILPCSTSLTWRKGGLPSLPSSLPSEI